MYVELKNINKTFGSFRASDNVSFGVEKGRLVGLLGPSGSGKTTILRMIAGLEQPDSGEVVIDGRVVNGIPAARRGIGFVFQSYALFRYMTVEDNIAFGLRIQKAGRSLIRSRVAEMIALVGLEGMERRYPSQLSGGQRQRVAFARALAPSPHLLLLDEPFAAIDAKVRQELRAWLKDMIGRLGITSIFVTHDQDEAVEVADEIIVTNKGRVEQVGTPLEIYRLPATAFTASFFGHASRLSDYRAFKDFQIIEGSTGAFVRPEFVRLTRQDEEERFSASSAQGVVRATAFRGTYIEVRVDVNGSEVVATRRLDESPLSQGERVNVFLHRIFVTQGERVFQLSNRSLKEDSVFI